MIEIITILVFTLLAGLCIPLGGLLASVERIHANWLEQEFRHFVIAFGGGVLLAAVALVLIPEGKEKVADPFQVLLAFLLGGLTFFLLEFYLGKSSQQNPQFLAMLLDFIPESLALGGVFATGATAAPLLAILIGLQNLPEGFNAYRELKMQSRYTSKKILLRMFATVPLGPIAALTGHFFLSQHPALLGWIMLYSGGGILYLIFQDIAPQAKICRHWLPALGAVMGFAIALLGAEVVQ